MDCVLIQANGDNVRLGSFFKQPKYELYYKGKKIIEHIIENAKKTGKDVYVALRKNAKINFDTENVNIIFCDKTNTRFETLKQCFNHLKHYESVIIHDCDVIIKDNILKKLNENSLVVTHYKMDGLKYGFVDLDEDFKYILGNEKKVEKNYITIGTYSVKTNDFVDFLNFNNSDSLLEYYNTDITKSVFLSKEHINLGDIESYFKNL
jgi:molybdopterin-guanine dinucleotide biosynthesis protein A